MFPCEDAHMDRMKLQVFNKLKQLEAANMASAPVNVLFNQHQAAFTAESH